MPNANLTPAWEQLAAHKTELEGARIPDLYQQSPSRCADMSCSAAGLTLDYSKNIATTDTMALLFKLAREHKLETRVQQLLSGEQVNFTEKRPALHTALRNQAALDATLAQSVKDTFSKMGDFVEAVHSGVWRGYSGERITDIVNIGIGGSDLGPFMVTEALKPYGKPGITCHFVANVDASDMCETLKSLCPRSTLFIVASKTFTTLETLTNAATAREWLVNAAERDTAVAKHFVAATANVENAVKFGIVEDNVFPMWDWVGGRYSLWSAIGLPIALAVGMQHFNELRAGAADMDQHFASAPLEENMPVIMAMLGIWYGNFWDAHSHAIIPYDHYLRYFAKYLQQLDMESNGKSASGEGFVDYQTGPIIWGEAGTNGQHSFHQLLHQGTRMVPVDFIAPLKSHNAVGEHHKYLFANCLSQSYALMCGKSLAEARQEFIDMGYAEEEATQLAPHKVMPGNRPSNTLVLDQVTPQTLGALIALYEHKVFVQSVIWEINAFDQWGVELGKKICSDIYQVIRGEKQGEEFDPSTLTLVAMYKNKTV